MGATGALLLVGGAAGLWRTRGYTLDPEGRQGLRYLAPWQFLVVAAAARRIAAPDVDPANVPSTDDTDVAGFVDAYVVGLPRRVRSDLMGLLGYLEHLAPMAAGHFERFSRLSSDAQDDTLRAMESSDVDLLRGAFGSLKALVFMGYYRDPRTWSILGYEGPRVAPNVVPPGTIVR
jgi:hypothetical protein